MNNISIEESKNVIDGFVENEVTVNWHGNKLVIKRTLTAMEMLQIVENVTRGSFNDDNASFTPELTDFVFLREVVEKYTNVDIPQDVEDLYALLYRTDIIDVIMDNINGRQFTKMYNAITTKIKYISETNVERIAAQMGDAVKQITDLVSNFASIMDGVTADDVTNLISAVSGIGSIDEAKLVDAVIGHQAKQDGQE